MYNDKFRMYGFVPYNISDIQKGIQFGHAVQEYNNLIHQNGSKKLISDFNAWKNNCKTFIILNGGTTNNNIIESVPEIIEKYHGTLNNYHQKVKSMGIFCADFHEPDLGDQLTAFVFIVPQIVYDRELCADFVNHELFINAYEKGIFKLANLNVSCFNEKQMKVYNDWANEMGGYINVELRNFLSKFKLA